MRHLAFSLIFLLSTLSRGQTDSAWDRYVGRAGDIYISEKEFQQRFEMLPALYRHRKPNLDVAKREFMASLLAEKLLVQEARARNLDNDSLYRIALLEIRKLLGRDQLYREEISQKIEVTPQEITAGVTSAQNQVVVSFMFFDREEDALFVREQMKTSADFDTFVFDSSMKAIRDTASVVWGEALPAIEEAAYTLDAGEVSPVIQAGEGYYILKCISVTNNTLYSSMQPHVLRERVVSRVRARKEKERLAKFLKTAFVDRVGFARPESLRRLADAISEVFAAQLRPLDSSVVMTSMIAGLVRSQVNSYLDDTLAVAGSTSWSVGAVLDRLVMKRFEVRREEMPRIPALLNIEIGFWVQQDLLGQEAVKRGLDQRPEVKRQLEIWEQATLAAMMKEYGRRQVHVTKEEVWKYLQYQDGAASVPLVQIRELRTGTIEQMQQALAELESGGSLEETIRKWSIDEEARKAGGLSEFFPITARSPIGSLAWQMEVGQRYGPIGVGDTIFFFELIVKEEGPELRDTSFAARKKKATQELLEIKRKRTVTLFIAQSAARRGVDVYDDVLKRVEVTPIPMMTFRLLGFGGRMFEIPFADPQIEWLDAEPPDETILP